ncbi:MAG: indolepyruvate ferredoxin oxidoreductase subunit alpha [Clostridiales bacterium]|jgi:indolepyruvate ferredoxin oxidoreductase alpha subunit|nr:indolepyruvate ferredoxin oxidoreductase subunit alpha [Clostridiales bacterium]
MRELMLGNAAIARGAYEAGVKVATAYPGTPSTEITEIISGYEEVYSEWSPNEKVAFEAALGASMAGARALVCMKHVGLNVAADPLFTASYTGVGGGLVAVVADDPGMFSSQNEQDTRFYARAAHVPIIEPSDSAEAKDFTKLAFELSEKYDTPVILRTTTRLAHGQSFVKIEPRTERELVTYVKNPAKYVMMPSNAKLRHIVVERRMDKLADDCGELSINGIEYNDKKLGIVCSGIVYQYVKEAYPSASVLKLGMVYPLPLKLIRDFAANVGEVIVIEELEPFIENQLKANGIACRGKEIFSKQGELSVNIIKKAFFGASMPESEGDIRLPARPPVLCAGCPHRGVFYVLNKLRTTVCGDIGCYTLGAMPPLNAVDSVVCMGAGIGMAHGFLKASPQTKNIVAVIGDSTFIHSGITGLIDSVYNKSGTTVIILDNSTTGMTGHQNHPATGKTIREEDTVRVDIEAICRACGVRRVVTIAADDLVGLERAVKEETSIEETSVIIARKPCELIVKGQKKPYRIIEKNCKRCRACLKIGCPAISCTDGKMVIKSEMCVGCGLCEKLCGFGAIGVMEANELL